MRLLVLSLLLFLLGNGSGLGQHSLQTFSTLLDRVYLDHPLSTAEDATVIAFTNKAWNQFRAKKTGAFRREIQRVPWYFGLINNLFLQGLLSNTLSSHALANLLGIREPALLSLLRQHVSFEEENPKYISTALNNDLPILTSKEGERTVAGAVILDEIKVGNVRFLEVDRVLFPFSNEDNKDDNKDDNEDEDEDDLTISTTGGAVKGIQLDDNHLAWRSIPYAKPPTGSRRFQPPEMADPWSSVLDVSALPRTCMQLPDTSFGDDFEGTAIFQPNTDMSEDCLYLQVHRPSFSKGKNLPVIVFIHGGGFMRGSSSLEWLDPKQIVEQGNVVFVSVQYRLGIFGFLSLGLDSNVKGNFGLLDQRLAMEWVRDNIAKFGGDASKTTLMGQSAGAVSVALHMANDRSRSLFTRAILQSGGLLHPWSFAAPDEALRRAGVVGDALQCIHQVDPSLPPTIEELESCLRAADASELAKVQYAAASASAIYPFVPTVDGDAVAKAPTDLFLDIANFEGQVLLGTNADEGSLFLPSLIPSVYQLKELSRKERTIPEEVYRDAIDQFNPNLPQQVRTLIGDHYADVFEGPDRFFKALIYVTSLFTLTCPVEQTAQTLVQGGNKGVYRYYFDHRPSNDPWPSYTGSKHGDEMFSVFGNPLTDSEKFHANEIALSKEIITFWTNFARLGDPNPRSDTARVWRTYSMPNFNFLELTTSNIGGAMLEQERREECVFLNEELPQLLGLP